ncbi:hypothetical protein SAMN05444407_103315 [Chryseobacterium contaminans]|uniref:Uncharacterized protein n=1 Tax=Chryseobacterium contaminans TaxID=1423959 RepID=A0A1M6ZP59_9FLAO|nr:hypothetical protein SAMN05444407_103315 [Chryseobacterium contaminans]
MYLFNPLYRRKVCNDLCNDGNGDNKMFVIVRDLSLSTVNKGFIKKC